jgi:molybdopterin/thiamine biosynthesis adenylyltransferase
MCFNKTRTLIAKLVIRPKHYDDKQHSESEQRERTVLLSCNVRDKIKSEADQAYQNGVETCGFLIGKSTGGAICISDATGPGKNPCQAVAKCEPDYSVLAPYLVKGHKVAGEWHLHLGYGSGLSSGDRNTLLNASAVIPGFIAMVVNMKSQDTLDMAAFSIRNGEVVKIEVESEERYARITELVDVEILASKIVVILGLGSGGSKCAENLARTGMQNFILVDQKNEKLEAVNLPRHIGFERDLGKPKTTVTSRILKMINKKVRAKIEHFDIAKDGVKLAEVVTACDLVLACPGDPTANALINKVCLELKKPAVFAGVFEKGKGGYVFALDPTDKDAACFSCLFGMAGMPDSNSAIRQTARNYGIEESQLHAQQGLCLDTSQIAILQTRVALSMLLKDTEHDMTKIDGNLIWADNRNLQTKVLPVKKREDCYVCNREAWLASVGSEDKQSYVEPRLKSSTKQRKRGFLSLISNVITNRK